MEQKWLPTEADSSIPYDIARISNYNDMDELTDEFGNKLEILSAESSNAENLESLRSSIAALRPYIVKREDDEDMEFDVLEIASPSGQSAARSVQTLPQLVETVRETISIYMDSDRRTLSEVSHHVRDLHAQDLRYFKYQLCNPYEVPCVMVRRHCVVLSLNPIRAIFTAKTIYLVAPKGSQAMLYLLQGMLSDSLHAVDPVHRSHMSIRTYYALFSAGFALHSDELNRSMASMKSILLELRAMSTVPIEIQDKIRVIKVSVSNQVVKAGAYLKMYQELSLQESNVALMNLTALAANSTLYAKPLSPILLTQADELQSILEALSSDYSSLCGKLEHLMAEIYNAESTMSLKLDTARNQLLIIDMTLATVSLTITVANFVIGIFGMNLYSGVEDLSAYYFWGLSILLVLAVILGSRFMLKFFNLSGKKFGTPMKGH